MRAGNTRASDGLYGSGQDKIQEWSKAHKFEYVEAFVPDLHYRKWSRPGSVKY